MTFRPLLASPAEDIIFPVYASIKIDGIRAMRFPEGLMSRRIKLIPNRHVRRTIESVGLHHCDGEIVTYTNGKWDNFNTVQSKVMSEDGQPNFVWFTFDHFENPNLPYEERYKLVPQGQEPFVRKLDQHLIYNQMQLDTLEAAALRDGWEGLIVRSRNGVYKYGRSTAREGILLKVVRKQRAEAKIIGYQERMHNANEATTNAMGYLERSSHKANKVGRGDLGSLDMLWDGIADGKRIIPEPVIFNVGTGFDDATRLALWQLGEGLKGRFGTFEFRGVGTNNRPRFPAWIGFRDREDFD